MKPSSRIDILYDMLIKERAPIDPSGFRVIDGATDAYCRAMAIQQYLDDVYQQSSNKPQNE